MFLAIAKVRHNWRWHSSKINIASKAPALKAGTTARPVGISSPSAPGITYIFSAMSCAGRYGFHPPARSPIQNCVIYPNRYLNISIDGFIVMPNHLHAIVVIDGHHRHSPNPETRIEPFRNGLVIPPKAGSLPAIVRSYKAGVTRRCDAIGLKNFAWQAGFYDHIVRGNTALQAIRDYIGQNPTNWPQDPENQP